jgi:putative redox protein
MVLKKVDVTFSNLFHLFIQKVKIKAWRINRMEMIIDFPGGLQVDDHFGPYKVETDQPGPQGQAGSAPTPFATFLASIGTCAGIYVLGFCKQRGIPTDGIRIIQSSKSNPFTGMVSDINLEIRLPLDFPEKYRDAVIRAADQCAVKKHFENPPEFYIYTKTMEKENVSV